MSAGGKGGVLDPDEPIVPPWGRRLVGRVDRQAMELEVLKRDLAQTVGAVKVLIGKKLEGGAGEAEGEGEKPKGQPDWIACQDAEAAERMLERAADWMDTYGHALGVKAHPCWPWHPAAVVLVLSAAEHHAAAYKGKDATKVTALLTTVLPAVAKQIAAVLGATECNARSHHDQVGGVQWAAHLEQLPDLAVWWATDRNGVAPGLTARLADVG